MLLERIWSEAYNVKLERELWFQVLQIQRAYGAVDVPRQAINRTIDVLMRPVTQEVLDRIEARERRTRHDLKARLEIFCEDCRHEWFHIGLTSADVVDNCMQIRVLRSLALLQGAYGLDFTALRLRYPFRGIKGPVGTQADQVDLMGLEKAQGMDRQLAARFGFNRLLDNVGQVYPRSLDFEVASEVYGKVNRQGTNRDPEWRGLMAVLAGYVHMLNCPLQWNEGDVSQSVVRRVGIPQLFLTAEKACYVGNRPREEVNS